MSLKFGFSLAQPLSGWHFRPGRNSIASLQASVLKAQRRVPFIGLVLSMMLALCGMAVAQKTNWEIEPGTDQRVPLGGVSVVAGSTNEGGVEFIVNNITVTNPLAVTLVSTKGQSPLELLVYKEAQDKALLQEKTSADGSVTINFRTDETVLLMVRGPEGSEYQLMVWAGPQIELEPASAFVSMDEYNKTAASNNPGSQTSLPRRESRPSQKRSIPTSRTSLSP